MNYNIKRAGFTLVELSIVIIIIGLLIAGIAGGRSLIAQARLNSVITEFQQNFIGIQTFKDKYDAIPGDMKFASAAFGSKCTIVSGCDGDGDGLIQHVWNWETLKAWHHLSIAGMIKGQYTGDGANFDGSAAIGGGQTVAGINAQNSNYSESAAWNLHNTEDCYAALSNSCGSSFNTSYTDLQRRKNILFVGHMWANNMAVGGLLTSSEAYSIESKMDDGKPLTGNMFTLDGVDSTSGGAWVGLNGCIDATQQDFKKTETSGQCIIGGYVG